MLHLQFCSLLATHITLELQYTHDIHYTAYIPNIKNRHHQTAQATPNI